MHPIGCALFYLTKPGPPKVARVLHSQRDANFTYAEIGATRTMPLPAGYHTDHHRIRLGYGHAAWDAALAAFRSWKMFELGWSDVAEPKPPMTAGALVAVLARAVLPWTINVARIVYTIDEPGRRFGFAYGTLPHHMEQGEELFTLECHEDGSIWYDIVAFSRIRPLLLKPTTPLATLYEDHFRRASGDALLRAINAK